MEKGSFQADDVVQSKNTFFSDKTPLETYLVSTDDAWKFCREEWFSSIRAEDLAWLIETGILPTFGPGRQWVLVQDLRELAAVGRSLSESPSRRHGLTLFSGGVPSRLTLAPGTRVDLPSDLGTLAPVFYPALRNLVRAAQSEADSPGPFQALPYVASSRLETTSQALALVAQKQVQRANEIDLLRLATNDFANSAYYMGTKHKLASFVIESIAGITSESSAILDLMCGSGVVSGACARHWPTFSSDAQEFCVLLAEVQGGGFTRERATTTLDFLLPHALSHASRLAEFLKPELAAEDSLFHAAAGAELIQEYCAYHAAVPTYPEHGGIRQWIPLKLVTDRKRTPDAVPYVLFTAYFANIFLGLRQAIEVDSLRFAIDQLADPQVKRWALGALIATVSRLATTYGGHFAQPLVHDWKTVELATLQDVLRMRSLSVTHEFTVRFTNLAEQSEGVAGRITPLKGPWDVALSSAEGQAAGRDFVVYLDPPYKREEYSRYYHVLETLVTYSYPDAEGRGKTPRKGGERFRSEFFTRSSSRMANSLAQIIETVLRKGWTCVWSYSDSSTAQVSDVISRLAKWKGLLISSYAAPYTHKSQGGRRPKQVREYVIIVQPSKR